MDYSVDYVDNDAWEEDMIERMQDHIERNLASAIAHIDTLGQDNSWICLKYIEEALYLAKMLNSSDYYGYCEHMNINTDTGAYNEPEY